MLESQKRWTHTERGKRMVQSTHLKYRTGLTLDDMFTLIKLQGNVCALCKKPFDLTPGYRKPDSPVVDHDHSKSCCHGDKSCSGCRRGIIHRRCNTGIGMFADDPVSLRLAAEYLEKYNGD